MYGRMRAEVQVKFKGSIEALPSGLLISSLVSVAVTLSLLEQSIQYPQVKRGKVHFSL